MSFYTTKLGTRTKQSVLNEIIDFIFNVSELLS